MAYKHEGFWRSMDTLRDWQALEDMVEKGNMPWSRQMHARAVRPAAASA
jgi:glucose-1-phosphate cytidylyltransferase